MVPGRKFVLSDCGFRSKICALWLWYFTSRFNITPRSKICALWLWSPVENLCSLIVLSNRDMVLCSLIETWCKYMQNNLEYYDDEFGKLGGSRWLPSIVQIYRGLPNALEKHWPNLVSKMTYVLVLFLLCRIYRKSIIALLLGGRPQGIPLATFFQPKT